MARWKARAVFFLSVIELLCLSLTVKALQGKICQNSLPSGVPKFQAEGGRPWGIFFWFLQNYTHFAIQQCKLHRATCRRFDTIQYDERTDGIDVASTALAMRALRRAVKMLKSYTILNTASTARYHI